MTTSGIGTQDRGMLYAAPSRIVYRPITNRVEASAVVTDRIDSVEMQHSAGKNEPGQHRLDIAA